MCFGFLLISIDRMSIFPYQNSSHVEALILNVMVLGGEDFEN
jgi:hypothetical protein